MNNKKFRVWDNEQKKFEYFELDNITVPDRLLTQDKFPVQQFTGLYDKNKKPIYEGDIVNVQRSFTRPYIKDGKIDYKTIDVGLEIGKVVWSEMKAAFLIAYKGYDDMDDFRYLSYSYEVIGNTFEQPELLNK